MINELETVVLLEDLPEQGLRRGDVGAVVHCYQGGEAFEVEFVTGEGRTVGVLTLPAAAVRRMQGSEILHARQIAA